MTKHIQSILGTADAAVTIALGTLDTAVKVSLGLAGAVVLAPFALARLVADKVLPQTDSAAK